MQRFAQVAYTNPLFEYVPLDASADRMRRERSPTAADACSE